MRTIQHYRDQLLALLPTGDAWAKEPDSELAKVMTGAAEEFARIDQRAQDVLRESHPSTAFEMLDEWLEQYGLPDDCLLDSSTQELRAALQQKYRQIGGQSRAFFIEVARILGYEITITEFKERTHGDEFGELFGTEDSNFIWQINAASLNTQRRTHGQSHGDNYQIWGNARLECVLSKLVHSHRKLIFSYT